jgi:hypothetical protein
VKTDLDIIAEQCAEIDRRNGEEPLPPVRSEPLLAAYDRFKHLDRVFELVGDPDGTENTDPFHAAARDLWRAVKASLGIPANTTAHLRAAQGEP